MALAPFFPRAYTAIGQHLNVTREALENTLSGHVIGLVLSRNCSVDGNDRLIAELLVNLLARLYPVITISGPDPGECQRIADLALAINPDLEVVFDAALATLSVFIGEPASTAQGFTAASSGWVARVGCAKENAITGGPFNPYSSGAAAALAAWRVFAVAVLGKDPAQISDISLSLLDFSENAGLNDPLPAVNLGEVAFAGIGAVGNPALWALARHPGLTGRIHLIDPQNVELSNLQRYCLPHFSDQNINKVALAQRELQHSDLLFEPWHLSLEDFADTYGDIGTIPTICVSVDNVEGRRVAQALLPRLVVNAWTGDGRLGASWHRFTGEAACLACLYHPSGISLSQTEMAANCLGMPHLELAKLWMNEKPLSGKDISTIEKHLHLEKVSLREWIGKRVQDVYTGVICGGIGVDLPAIGHVATVPLAHQSVLAGIFMAAELVKRLAPELESKSQPQPLILWDDIKCMPPISSWARPRAKKAGCFCGDPIYQEAFRHKWGLA